MQKNKKVIVHIITSLKVGGAETVLTNVVINTKEFEHIIISLKTLDFYGEKIRKAGLKVVCLRMKPGISLIKTLIMLFFLLRRYKPLIVHTWLYHADIIGGITAKIAGIKKIYWSIRNDYNPSEIKWTNKVAIRLLAFLSYYIPNKIISCSEVAANSHRLIGYKSSIITVIPNGVCTLSFNSVKSINGIIRRKNNIGEDEFLIGMIARFHPIKDHCNLLHALSIVKSKGKIFKCILLGRGISSENNDLNNIIQKLNLEKQIILLSETMNLREIFNSLNIHVLSSHTEGFSNVLIQSMSCCTPCISTNSGDAKIIIGNTGWIVERRDPKELSNAIIESMTMSDKELKTKGLSARKRVQEKFTLQSMLNKYELLYK